MRRAQEETRTVDENCSTTALGSDATFTGIWFNALGYNALVVSVKTDKAGTLYIDFSPDATNADSTLTYEITASSNEVHKLTISKKYFRVRVVNGASAQSYMRLQTLVGSQDVLTSPLNQPITGDTDAITVKAISDELLFGLGLITGYSTVHRFGRNLDIDTGSLPEDLWQYGGTYTGFPSAAEQVYVVSDSADDTSAGTGLRTIYIEGLDSNYNAISETITLNGLTPVLSTNSYLRCQYAYGVTAGSSGTNAGNITGYQAVTTTNRLFYMIPETNITNVSAYTVPAGHTAYLKKITVECRTANANISGHLYMRNYGGLWKINRPFDISQNTGVHQEDIYGGFAIPEKSDMVIRISYTSVNNTAVSAFYDIMLVRE